MRPEKRARSHRGEATGFWLTIVWHPDVTRVGEAVSFQSNIKLSRLEPEFSRHLRGGVAATLSPQSGKRPLGDPNVSRRPLELSVASRGELEVRAPASGSDVAIDGVPITKARVLSPAELARGVVIALASRVVLVVRQSSMNRGGGEHLGLVGTSAEVAWMVEQIERVAASDAHVLLRGATGTGKELVAAAIHEQSTRRSGAFVAVNMTTLPAPTASSQLFGHRRGAFTGADSDHAGFFGAANGGSLFLDEIGETPTDVQAMLLRALESSAVTPVGSAKPSEVDVRIISATDADLEAAAHENRFRSPLLHRLAGYQIDLPTLADRREDVGPLLVHFLRDELRKVSSIALDPRAPTAPMWLSAEQAARLAVHRWPGNVRQLRNLARRLAIACGDAEVVSDDELRRGLATGRGQSQDEKDSITTTARPVKRRPDDVSDRELVDALRANAWKTSAAATELGISRTSLYALIERCDLVRKARDLMAAEINSALAASGGDTAAAATVLEVSERGLKLRIKELEASG